MKTAKHIIDFYFDSLLERADTMPALAENRSREKSIAVHRHGSQSYADQAHFVGIVAKALGLGEEPVWEEVKRLK